jgi:c-di-GMP-binding flagellar brake protein YcgR
MTIEADNRRNDSRIPVRLAVTFERGERTFRLRSENLSLGGVFLNGAQDVCSANDSVELVLTVPNASGDLELHALRGTVVRIIPTGIGIRFDWHLSMERARLALVRFVEREGLRNNAGSLGEAIGSFTEADEEPAG